MSGFTKRCAVPLLGAALMALSGCAVHYTSTRTVPRTLKNYRKLAVILLQNNTANAEADRVVTEILTTELGRVKSVELIDSDIPSARPDGTPRPLSEVAHEIVRKNGAEILMFGSVLEYSYKEVSEDDPVGEPVVAVDLRLLDTLSGNVVWGGTFVRTSSSAVSFAQNPITAVTHQVAADIALSLQEARE